MDIMQRRMVSQEEFDQMCVDVSSQMTKDRCRPDIPIGLMRGGLEVLRQVSDLLGYDKNNRTLDVDHWGADARPGEATIRGSLPEEDISGQSVLVVDDINDTGRTLKTTEEYMDDRGAEETVTAVLMEKRTSDFRANYYARRVDDDYFIFPGETVECVGKMLRDLPEDRYRRDELDIELEKMYRFGPGEQRKMRYDMNTVLTMLDRRGEIRYVDGEVRM